MSELKTASLGFQSELRTINDSYFAVWCGERKRWQVRTWGNAFYIPKLGSTFQWKSRSKLILEIRKENDVGDDIGYQNLDYRTIRTIREGLYHARNIKDIIQEIDKANDKREENFSKTQEAIARDMATRIWHRFQEPTVYLGGK